MADKMKMINLTKRSTTKAQAANGVVEPDDKAAVQAALTFGLLPNAGELTRRANILAAIAAKCTQAMIDGPAYLMAPLEAALKASGIIPLYAFSGYESEEAIHMHTGEVTMIQTYKHIGFIIGQG